MKKSTLIKQLIFASLLLGGMNIFSSCNSCSNKEKTTEESTLETTTYETSSDEDTVSSGDMNDGSTSSTSINATSGSGGSKSNTTRGNNTATVTKTPAASAASNAKKEDTRQQAITDMVENSDAKSAVDKNGKPIRSSGDAGTGSGTGTGSTGNNSRVTTREAQKGN